MIETRPASAGLLRILLLEDDPRDEELIREAVSGLESRVDLVRVDSAEAFRAAVDEGGWGVILSDFSLPRFDGLSALALVRERDLDLPFILVTGSVPEERAVEIIRMRATDYVSKDRLVALPHAIERALREVRHARLAREAEERARLLVDAAVEGIFTVDDRGRLRSANPALQRLTGYAEGELVGRDISLLLAEPWRTGQDESAARPAGAADDPRQWASREVALLAKDGSRIAAELSTSAFRFGRRELTAGFLRDLTERRKMEEQLRQSQKLEALGSLSAGIAHDFNNILAVVNGYSDLALEKLPPDSEVHRYVDQIRAAGEHAAALTRQLLSFSRRQVVSPELISLRDLVGQLGPMLRRIVGERIRLEVAADPETPLVHADENQLQQVLFNLAINARDAMPDGGLLRIACGLQEFDEEAAARHVGLTPGKYAALSVVDTGMGMSAEVQKRIFEPFFTTKGAGRGTGLGLATVFGIVRQSGGQIWFYSELGSGTTFRIFLPARLPAGAPSSAGGSVAEGVAAVAGARIAVVEDDPIVRRVVCRLLSTIGYELVEFESSRDAAVALASPEGRFDLLLSDLVMPEMSGDELARRARAVRPDLKVLFMSGYSEDLVQDRLAALHPYDHVAKPFSARTLREKVRRAVAGEAPVGDGSSEP